MKSSLAEPAISDGALTDIQKNAVAGLLRSGLAVLAFAITEDFIRDRTAEVLRGFVSPNIKFTNLSDLLQHAVTISALKGILFRSEFQDKSNKITWILGELAPIANLQNDITNLSSYSFGHTRSNLTYKDITEILSAFGVDGGWSTLSIIAKRIGLGGAIDYSQAFKELANRRHRAAHSIKAQIPLNDLNDSINIILGICSAFDILLSQSLSDHNSGKLPNKANGYVSPKNILLRFISPHPTYTGKFREQTEIHVSNTFHTHKVYATLADAESEVGIKAKALKEQLVFLKSNGIPERWETW